MRKIVLIVVFILFTLLTAGAVKKIEANAINVAVMLTEQVDSTGLASTCQYYGYEPQPSQDGYAVYKHSNGSVIRYKFTTAEDGKGYPTIEVKSKGTQKDKDQLLQSLNFQKNGNAYDRRSIAHHTRCTSTPGGFLRFTNQPKPKKEL